MIRLLKDNKGFTLIELLATITLLSIVIISFMAIFTNAFHFNSINADNMKAMNIAREKQAIFKENPNLHEAMYQFIADIRNGEPNNLSSGAYSTYNLNLVEDIKKTSNDGCFGTYLMKLEESPYTVKIYITMDYDVPALDSCPPVETDVDEQTTFLYRLHVEVFDIDTTNLISETYTYFEYKEGEENEDA